MTQTKVIPLIPLDTLKTWDLRSQRASVRGSLGPSTHVDVSIMGKGYMCIVSTQNEVPLELCKRIQLLSWYMYTCINLFCLRFKMGEGMLKTNSIKLSNSSTKEENTQLTHFRNKTHHLQKLRLGHAFFSNCRLNYTRCNLMPGDHLGISFGFKHSRGVWVVCGKGFNLTEFRPAKCKWDCLDMSWLLTIWPF